jgi:hypothetical protein
MGETLPLPVTIPPPLPPRRSPLADMPPPPLPPRLPPLTRVRTEPPQPTTTSPEIARKTKAAREFEPLRPRHSSLQKSRTIPVTSSDNGEPSTIRRTESLPPSPPPTTPQKSVPGVPALLLSFALKEPLERSHGRLSTITAVQSLFQSVQSKLPPPPPFEYSSLVDHALLAGQIYLHDPEMRQQKRLPIAASLSICAFLIAATGIVPRYVGWVMLAAATWFGPGRHLMTDLWYISVGAICLGFLVDVFPMLSLGMLLWIGIFVLSKGMEGVQSGERRQIQSTSQFIGSTASSFQNFDDTKKVALDVVVNISEWWTYRQSEPERTRRKQEKAAKLARIEEKKAEKIRKAESIKQEKQDLLDQKAAEKLKKDEDERELKRVESEAKAEKLRRGESIKQEKQALLDQKAAEKLKKEEDERELKRVESEAKAEKQTQKAQEKERIRVQKEEAVLEKERRKEEELALKRVKSEQKALEKEARKQEKLAAKLEIVEKPTEETGHQAREAERLAQEAERLKQETARLNGGTCTEETTKPEMVNDNVIDVVVEESTTTLLQGRSTDVNPAPQQFHMLTS